MQRIDIPLDEAEVRWWGNLGYLRPMRSQVDLVYRDENGVDHIYYAARRDELRGEWAELLAEWELEEEQHTDVPSAPRANGYDPAKSGGELSRRSSPLLAPSDRERPTEVPYWGKIIAPAAQSEVIDTRAEISAQAASLEAGEQPKHGGTWQAAEADVAEQWGDHAAEDAV
jgi:hypothetical protein